MFIRKLALAACKFQASCRVDCVVEWYCGVEEWKFEERGKIIT